MGLELAQATAFGINANYWKVYRLDDLNYMTGMMHGWLAGYISKEVRDEDARAIISTAQFSMPIQAVEGDLRNYIYATIKTSKPVLVSPAVDAIAAVDEVKDAEGNIITPAQAEVPAVEAVYQEMNKWSLATDA